MPAAYALHRNKHEDDFDCFRYWEIGSLGVKEYIFQNLPSSKTPKLPTAKATNRSKNEVIGKNSDESYCRFG